MHTSLKFAHIGLVGDLYEIIPALLEKTEFQTNFSSTECIENPQKRGGLMTYKKIDAADVAALVSICGQEHVKTRKDISEDYSHDELAGIRVYPRSDGGTGFNRTGFRHYEIRL